MENLIKKFTVRSFMVIAVSASLHTLAVLNAITFDTDSASLISYPPCYPPGLNEIIVTNISYRSAKFRCTKSGGSIEFRYAQTDNQNCTPIPDCYSWRPTLIADANGIVEVSGLRHRTPYIVEARIFCNGSWSTWSDYKTFRTDECSPPSADLVTSTNSYTTARLICNQSNRESYNFRYRILGSSIWEYTEWRNSSSVDLEGLAMGTTYEFSAAVRCEYFADSDFSETEQFTTLACPAPALHVSSATYDFALVECNVQDKDYYSFRVRPVGTNSWIENYYNGTSHVLPMYDLTQGTEYEVQCKVSCRLEEEAWSEWSTSLFFTTEACVSPTNLRRKRTRMDKVIMNCDHPSDPERFQWQWKEEGKSIWKVKNQRESQLTINHPNILPGTKYTFRVKAECPPITENGSSTWGDWTREITFTTQCDAIPSDRISVDEITPNSAKITCEISGAVLYVFELIDPVTGNARQNVETDHVSVFDNLIAGKNYQYRIRMTCTYGQTEWAEGEFSTLAVCDPPKPSWLNSLQVSHNRVVLECTGDAEKYEFRYRNSMDSDWTTKAVQQNGKVEIIGLEPKQDYIWQCRMFCNGVWSDWSIESMFSTLCASPALNEIEANNITSDKTRLNCYVTGYNKYQFRYKKEAENTWYPVIDRTVAYVDLTLLDADTKYEYQIRYECNGQNTDWSPSGFFQTLQDTCTVADTSDFGVRDITTHSVVLEGYTSGEYPLFRWKETNAIHWQVAIPDPGKAEVPISTLQPGILYEFQYAYKCPTALIVSDWSASKYFTTREEIICDPVATDQFNAVDIHSDYAYLECYVQSTNGSADFYEFRYREFGATSWSELDPGDYRIKIEKLLPGTRYDYQVRIKCDGDYSPWSRTNSFITPEENMDSNCDSISEHDYDAVWIGETRADLQIYIDSALLYDFRYRVSMEGHWTDTDEDANYSREITGLDPGTEYEYQVRYWCDTAFTPWSSSKFFMTGAFDMTCDAPDVETLSSRDSTGNMVVLNCSLNQVREYQFRYQSEGDSTWITLNSSQNNENVAKNLAPDKNYAFQCRIMCMETEFSEWSDTVYFSTSVTTSSRDFATLKWNVYPIPASDYINIQTGDDSEPYDLTLYDITGKLVLQVEGQRSPLYRLDFQLMPGFYILKCKQGEALGIRRMVVQ